MPEALLAVFTAASGEWYRFLRDCGRRAVRNMSAESQRTCPSCGNEFSGAMEFCPVCMLCKGLGGGIESGESSTADTLELKPVEPAQRFDL
jgi:hypothetical protein